VKEDCHALPPGVRSTSATGTNYVLGISGHPTNPWGDFLFLSRLQPPPLKLNETMKLREMNPEDFPAPKPEDPSPELTKEVYEATLLTKQQYADDLKARWKIIRYELQELRKDGKTYWTNIKKVTKSAIQKIKDVAP